MTFEEFFIKKRIDLTQLEAAEPALFSEFKSHFELMGEKSFDQIKKFWFNKLRRSYHLKEVPKPAKETIVKEKIASQAESLSSPTLDQKPEDFPASRPVAPDTAEAADQTEAPQKPAIKPKFTPRNIPSKPQGTVIGELPIEEVKKEDASKPAATFKPRFNPKNIKNKNESDTASTGADNGPAEKGIETDSPTNSAQETKEPAAKPGFRPRFNMKSIKSSEQPLGKEETRDTSGEKEITSQPPASTPQEEKSDSKPAYKPRFNMRNVQPKEESGVSVPASASEKGEEQKDRQTTGSEVKITPDEQNSPDAAVEKKEETKPAYKPRFKMKNVQPKEESGISIPASAPEVGKEPEESQPSGEGSQEQGNDTTVPTKVSTTEEETKLAYKPRFNMKNIKPKPEE